MRMFRQICALLREIVYPEGAVCAACGRVSDAGYLCGACREELRNAGMLESWDAKELMKGITVWSMRPHRGAARTMVLRLKHSAEAPAARELAALLRDRPALFPAFPPETVVTWVPGPQRRIRERCIDHGRMLAEAVAEELGLPCEALLARRGNDRPQARLNREEREANLRNAFEARGKIGCPVLLVDDVLTTGTTATRCAEALRAGGARQITVLTATHAVRRKK